jgi:hypothetical protein
LLRTIILFWSMVVLATGALTTGASAQLIFPPPAAAPKPAAPKPPPGPSGPSALEIERAAYNNCANARTAGPCRQYLAKYPKGGWADLARTRVTDLETAERERREAAERAKADQPPPAPVVIRETVDPEKPAWAACEASTSPEACNRYIASFPRGPSIDAARAKVAAMNAAAQERAAWTLCQNSDAPGPCDAYVTNFPAGSQVVAARARIAQIAAASQERTAWLQCANGTAAAPCNAYLAAFPNGAQAGAARLRIANIATAEQENAAWQTCQNGSVADCERYVSAFPGGSQVGAARARATMLANAERERATAAANAEKERAALALCQNGESVLPCENYLAAYPSGSAAADVRARIARINLAEQEKTAWSLCETGKQLLPCEKYLAAFPSGRFVEPARTRIKVLETAETEPEMVPALGIIVKRSDKGEFVVVSVQQFSSAMGNVFGGDVITKINDAATDPRSLPRAALEAGLAASNGRVKLLVRRGPATVTAVIRAKP